MPQECHKKGKREDAFKEAEQYSFKLDRTRYRVKVAIFKSIKAMRTGIRKFFEDKREGAKLAKHSLGLAVADCVSGHFESLIFLTKNTSVEVIAHESAHIIVYYYTLKRKKFDLKKDRTNEDFAEKAGKLTENIFNVTKARYRRARL